MKKLLSAIIVILSLCITSSCTQNNGYIGELFGRWQLHEITSADATEIVDTMSLAFQAEVVVLRIVNYENYEFNAITGLFNHQSDSLTLSFINLNGTDSTDSAARANLYNLLAKLHIERLNPTFHIDKLTWQEMELQYNGYNYSFEKL